MEYKVIPFIAVINQQKETTNAVAGQLENLIKQYTDQGWEYVRVESVSTFIEAESGCFGIGAKPAHLVASQMVVFSKIS